MATLAEIRAANKAKLEQHQASTIPVAERIVEKTPSQTVAQSTTIAEVVKQEEPIPTGKPLTFAEKMALKKAGLASTPQSVPVTTASSSSTSTVSKPISIIDGVVDVAVKQEQSVLQKVTALVAPVYVAEVDNTDLERQEYVDSSDEVKTAYKDIKGRINALSDLPDGHLETAMSELKKALLQNPSACLLLYDEDLGVLASTLRRLVHEDMVASIKPAKEKKEAKTKLSAALQIPLTEEMLATKFADL